MTQLARRKWQKAITKTSLCSGLREVEAQVTIHGRTYVREGHDITVIISMLGIHFYFNGRLYSDT